MKPTARPLTSRRPAQPLHGAVRVPGDRTISHRALMLAGLAVGETRIAGLPDNGGVLRTAAALRALGAEIVRDGPGAWRVAGRGVGGLREPGDVLDIGNSGDAARLLCGVLAGHDLFAVVTGDANLRRQPMRQVTEPLQACGARFQGGRNGCLPLAIQGARDALPIECRLPAASAQAKSALLLAGLNAPGWTRIEEPAHTHDHSERMLLHFGAEVRTEQDGASRVVHLRGQPELMAADVVVPGDASLAAFPLVAALLVPGSAVTVLGMGLNPLRTGWLDALRGMGAQLDVTHGRIESSEAVGDVTATYTGLHGADIPAGKMPGLIDDVPILAVAAACAHGTTRMRGMKEAWARGSERIAATGAMLRANGVDARMDGDDFLVRCSRKPGGDRVEAQMDHRIALSALILGMATDEPVGVDDASVIDARFPGFADLMRSLGAALA